MLLCLALWSQLHRPTFADSTQALKLSFANDKACWVDLDQDGWIDLIAGGTALRNVAGKKFEKIADGLGSVVAADYDNDGWPDLFSYSQMKLYRNLKGKGFQEVPLPSLPATVSRGACWADLNGDGRADLYIGGYENWERQITYPSFILMNEGSKGFKLTWTSSVHRTRGVTACDFSHSGAPSIYASNYRLQPNDLWVNDGKGGLKSEAAEFNALAASPGFDGGHSIGACWGDFNNDGEFDLFAGNFAHVDSRGDQPKSRFLKNLGPKSNYHFQDLGTCGVWYQESYASPAAADADNDGLLDLFFTTVYGIASFGKPNYPVLYHNLGNFAFADETSGSGLEKLPPTYAAAFADYNNDGREDLCTAGKVFTNNTSGGHWIEVLLKGDGVHVNRSAIGAQVRIRLKKEVLSRQVEAGTGEGNQNSFRLHFGLGSYRGPVNLMISWPVGRQQTIYAVPTGQVVTVTYRL